MLKALYSQLPSFFPSVIGAHKCSTRSGAKLQSSVEEALLFSLYLAQRRGYPLQRGSISTVASYSWCSEPYHKERVCNETLALLFTGKDHSLFFFFCNSHVPTLQPPPLLIHVPPSSHPHLETSHAICFPPNCLSPFQALPITSPPPHTCTHIFLFS